MRLRLQQAPAGLLSRNAAKVCQVAVALYVDKDPHKAIDLLSTSEYTSAPSGTTLVNFWFQAWYEIAGAGTDLIKQVRQRQI